MLSPVGWKELVAQSFSHCRAVLKSQVTLADHNESFRLFLYIDALDLLCSGTVTPIPSENLSKRHTVQRHQPLCFLSGHFSKTQHRWFTLEKVAYAFIATVGRMHWLLSITDGLDLYTHSHNLVFFSVHLLLFLIVLQLLCVRVLSLDYSLEYILLHLCAYQGC